MGYPSPHNFRGLDSSSVRGEGGTERSSVPLLMRSMSEEGKPLGGERDVQGLCVLTTPQHTACSVSTVPPLLEPSVPSSSSSRRPHWPGQLVSCRCLPPSHTPARGALCGSPNTILPTSLPVFACAVTTPPKCPPCLLGLRKF